MGFPGGSEGKESACNAGDSGSIPGLGRFPWTPIFLPGETHGQRSLVGYGPWGPKESDAERLILWEKTHSFQTLLNAHTA